MKGQLDAKSETDSKQVKTDVQRERDRGKERQEETQQVNLKMNGL